MQWKCLVYTSLIVAVHSASIIKKDIPVKVVYEKPHEYRNYASVRNLDEKTQLSPEELKQAQIPQLEDHGTGNPNAIRNLDEKVQLSLKELAIAYKHIPVQETIDDDLKTSDALETNTNKGNLNEAQLYEKIQEIIKNGVKQIKDNVRNSEDGKSVLPEVWKKLDNDIEIFIKSIKERHALRQSQNPNFFQGLVNQFQNLTNGFVSTFGGGQQNPQNDEPQQGQNIFSIFTNGFQQITSSLSNLTGQQQQSTILGDEATTQSNNPIQGFVSQVQQVFSGASNPLQAISNLNPFNQSPAPGTQSDETTQGGPLQAFQNAFSQFGQTINNLNPFNQATQAPAAQGDDSTQAGPLQFVQGIANQAGQVFNNLNPFNQQATTKQPDVAPADPTKNPIQAAAENVGSQISQGISNPSQALQGLVEQVSGGLNLNNTLATGVAEQVGQAIGTNPLQSANPAGALQSVAGQIGEAINSNNPLTGNPIGALQNGKTESSEIALKTDNPTRCANTKTPK